MLGFNIRQMAADELKKVQADIKNSPKFQLVEKQLEADLKILEEFEARVTPDEMANALNLLFPSKFKGAEIKAMEGAISRIISTVTDPAGLIQSVEDAIEGNDKAKK